jgi:C4-dicarboxylate-specific signal transduction histidine kinase
MSERASVPPATGDGGSVQDRDPIGELQARLLDLSARFEGKVVDQVSADEFLAAINETSAQLEQLSAARSRALDGFRVADRLRVMGASTAGLAHELRSPLSSMSMQAQVSLMRKDLDEDMRSDLENMLKGVRRMTEMVTTAVEFAEGSMAPKKVTIGELVERIRPFFKIRVRHADIGFDVEVPQGMPAVRGVEVELAQVLINVLDNGLNAVEQPGVSEPRVALRAWAEDGQVHIEVEDNGAGISDELAPWVFSEFAVGEGGGYGLGLPLARHIVEKAGGTIELASLREPTRILIKLPAV